MVKTAFLFPGQGSQFVGMGREFHEISDFAKDVFARADRVTGRPITRLCFEGPMEELTDTVNLQPAMTAVCLVCQQALADRGLVPDAVAGHSLGEYPALAAAGVIDAETALKLVTERGRLMQRDASARPGAMQAIIGLTFAEVEAVCELAGGHGIVAVANDNSPQQVVITGEAEAVATAARLAKTKGAKAMPLPVSGAWHSPLMADAGRDFAGLLAQTPFSAPRLPVYLNVTGEPENDPERIREIMIRQLTSPVRFTEIVRNLRAAGCDLFVEVGPKKVLSGLVKKTTDKDPVGILSVQDPAGLEPVETAMRG